MEIVNERGTIVLENKVYKDIAQIAALKVDGVYPYKKENDFAVCKFKEEALTVTLNVRLTQDIDVVKTCSTVQGEVRRAIEEMTGITCDSVNVEVQGFVKE